MTNVDPGAIAATWRNVAAIASLVRYMLTPVEATIAGRPDRSLRPPAAPTRRRPPRSRPARAAATPGCRSRARSGAAASTPEAGPVDLEHAAWRHLRPALREGIQAGAEDDVLADAATTCSTTRSSMKRARATIEARNGRVPAGPCPDARRHRRPARPTAGRLVFEHVRRRIDLDVQRAPQGDRTAVLSGATAFGQAWLARSFRSFFCETPRSAHQSCSCSFQ